MFRKKETIEVTQSYLIVANGTLTKHGLEKDVNALIAEGWRPQGGLCGTSGGGLYQAMVRYTESSDIEK